MKMSGTGLLGMILGLIIFMSACSWMGEAEVVPPASDIEQDGLKPVVLSWYLPINQPLPDLASVEEAVNAYIETRIGAKLKIHPVSAEGYEDTLIALLAKGEPIDLVWTSNWQFNYAANADKGAFLDIGDMVKALTPEFYASLPEWAWEDAKHRGTLYAVPNYQISASLEGFVVQKELADKYGLDPASIRSFADLEPFLEAVRNNEPDKIPFSATGTFQPRLYGYEGYGGAVYKKGDPDYTLVDPVFTEAFMKHHKLVHAWYEKGYINSDVATANLTDVVSTGKVAAKYDRKLKPGGEAEELLRNGGHEVIYLPLTEPEFEGVKSTLTAVSRTSSHPEQAVKLLGLLNTDPVLYNLLAFGIEGKHYEKLGTGLIRLKPDGGYAPNHNWRIGNVTIGYVIEGQPENTWDETIELNERAVIPELYGFSFDPTSVKTVDVRVQAATKEYSAAIQTGAVDPEVYLPLLREAMTEAGNDELLAEKQKQLNQFLKSHQEGGRDR